VTRTARPTPAPAIVARPAKIGRSKSSTPVVELVEPAVRAVGLIALLAPLAGFLIRLISFALDPVVPDPWYLASFLPVTELAATGAQLIPIALFGSVATLYVMRIGSKVAKTGRSARVWIPIMLGFTLFVSAADANFQARPSWLLQAWWPACHLPPSPAGRQHWCEPLSR
jgi:hypothetical protein